MCKDNVGGRTEIMLLGVIDMQDRSHVNYSTNNLDGSYSGNVEKTSL